MRVVLLLAVFSSASAEQILHLNEGDICKEGSPTWYCKLHTDCPGVKENIKKHQFPKICSFKGRGNPIVCCLPEQAKILDENSQIQFYGEGLPTWGQPNRPTENSNLYDTVISGTIKQSKSSQKCQEYAKYVFKEVQYPSYFLNYKNTMDFCGRVVTTLIVGGEAAGPREFPHMARIGYGEVSRIQWLCGGSLISERFILSAAHCTEPKSNVLAEWANLGDLDVTTDLDDADPVTIKIIERMNHPGYKKEQLYNDIALYRLETNAPLGIYIRPICLNRGNITRTSALASGWGHTFWGGEASSVLQKVTLPLVSDKHCLDSYQSSIGMNGQLPEGIISDYMFCAGGHKARDTCQGDSGGPLQISLDSPYCTYSIIGVTSFGKRCGDGFPGVYTNVAHYVEWIESIVWPT